jgi:hypothetical protein
MKLTEVQDLAMQARIAGFVGAEVFDRLFSGILFEETEGQLLFVYAKDEDTANEIEENFTLPLALIASAILNRAIDDVLVLPTVLQ